MTTAGIATWRRKLGTAARMAPEDCRLMAEAVTALLSARARSRLPFRTLALQQGGLRPPSTTHRRDIKCLSDGQAASVRKVRWVIGAAAPWMPFRARCLQQALAARAMLARRGIDSVLHLAVGDPTGLKMEAHAWLDAGGLAVTGYPVHPALKEVGCFF